MEKTATNPTKILTRDCRNIGQQLHDIRISKKLSLDEVSHQSRVPVHLIDAQEIGLMSIKMDIIYKLAKLYGKKVQISLIDC